MKERHVLSSIIKDRSAFDRIIKHVGPEDFTEQGRMVFESVVDYYDNDSSSSSVDVELLGEAVARRVSADKHKHVFKELVNSISMLQTSPANVVSDLLQTKLDVTGRQLASALLGGENCDELLREYQDILDSTGFDDGEEPEDDRIGYSVEELVSANFGTDNLVRLAPLSLNRRLDGGVKPGHHVILFARPEMGKTMAVIEMMAGFVAQDLTVLYVGNEDPVADINMRIVNRLTGMTKLEVINKPKEADKIARTAGYENIILHSATPGTVREIRGLIEKYKPEVLILDQLRNVDMKQDNYVLSLENAAKAARQFAKGHDLVCVSVTQAGDSAAGKAVLDMGDVDFSNTGIPSQADLMIGLGANDQHAKNGEIVYSLPKNKISGRHEFFACQVEPHLSKINPID